MPDLTTKDALLEKMVEQTALLKDKVQVLMPVGCVEAFAGSTTPDGWLLCDGSAVSRTDYADLYTVIGDTYGAGDGSTTFNLPNLIDKFIEGSSTVGTEKSAGLPNITGDFTIRSLSSGSNILVGASGSLSKTDGASTASVANGSGNQNFSKADFDASRSSSVYGNSTTVQPPALTMRYIIKY